MDKSMQNHLQSVIDELQDIVENHPFHAFALLAIVVELLGKCLNNNLDWQHYEPKGKDFNTALNTYKGLNKYATLQVSLYNTLRCGMVHAFLPKEGIQLVPDRNDLSNNTIGCRELYEDIIAAFNEVKNGNISPAKDMSKSVLQVNGSLSGATMDNKIV